jgi:hypothetical protein
MDVALAHIDRYLAATSAMDARPSALARVRLLADAAC